MPSARLVVRATIVSVGIAATVSCANSPRVGPPPTCGPCCHGGGPECAEPVPAPVEDEEREAETGEEREAKPGDSGPVQVVDPEGKGDDAGKGDGDAVGGDGKSGPVQITNPDPGPEAPTCGPCCHGGGPECGDRPK